MEYFFKTSITPINAAEIDTETPHIKAFITNGYENISNV